MNRRKKKWIVNNQILMNNEKKNINAFVKAYTCTYKTLTQFVLIDATIYKTQSTKT